MNRKEMFSIIYPCTSPDLVFPVQRLSPWIVALPVGPVKVSTSPTGYLSPVFKLYHIIVNLSAPTRCSQSRSYDPNGRPHHLRQHQQSLSTASHQWFCYSSTTAHQLSCAPPSPHRNGSQRHEYSAIFVDEITPLSCSSIFVVPIITHQICLLHPLAHSLAKLSVSSLWHHHQQQ